jgi:hypothetical protein
MGKAILAKILECTIMMARGTPIATPAPNPSSASTSVTHEWPSIESQSSRVLSQTRIGDGSKYLGGWKMNTNNCQITGIPRRVKGTISA